MNVSDLITFAAERNPSKFQDAFNQIMAAKVVDALEVKKQEVAGNYFTRPSPQDEDDQ